MNKDMIHCLENLSDSFSQISKLLDEMAFIIDQDENESDEKEYVNLSIGKGWQLYNSAIKAICEGSKHEAILLSSIYEFDKNNTINNVLDCEHLGVGCGNRSPVDFENDGNGNIVAKEIHFINATGMAYSVVVFNEIGLIAFYELPEPAILNCCNFSVVTRI